MTPQQEIDLLDLMREQRDLLVKYLDAVTPPPPPVCILAASEDLSPGGRATGPASVSAGPRGA